MSVYRTHRVKINKAGQPVTYESFKVIEHKNGERLFHTFSDPAKAKEKTQGIADAIARGRSRNRRFRWK